MRGVFCILLIVFELVSSVSAIELIAPEIIGLVEKDGKGKYQTLVWEASTRASLEIDEHYFPQKRALLLFFKKKYPCIYGYTDLAVETLGAERLVASFPLGVFKQYIFTKKGTPALTSINQLIGKSVGGVLGDDLQPWYIKFTQMGIDLDLVRSTDQNIKKLQHNRLDAMVSFLPDIQEYVNELSFAPESPLFTAYDRVTCHYTPETKAFIEKLSASLKEIKHDGTLQRILGMFYLEFDDNKVPSL